MKRTRTLHRLAGLLAGPLILIAAGTAIGLNHQDAVRGAIPAGPAGGPFSRYVLATAVDPRDAGRILVGTGDGLFRTSDGGRTWEEVVLPVPAEQAGAIAFDPARPGVVYAAFRRIGVWRSDDGGVIWDAVALPFEPVEGVEVAGLAVASGGGLVLATPRGIWRQPDPGGAWRHETAGPSTPDDAGKERLRLLYALHDGTFWRDWGVPVTDAVAAVLIGLVASGYALVARAWWRRRPRAARP